MCGISLYYSEIISYKINISSIISTCHCHFLQTQSNLSKASDLLMDCHGTFTIKVISMIKIGFQCYRCLSYQMTAQAFIRKNVWRSSSLQETLWTRQTEKLQDYFKMQGNVENQTWHFIVQEPWGVLLSRANIVTIVNKNLFNIWP